MLFRSYAPRAPLDAFIADFWLYRDYGGEHQHERILPSGTFEMVFNLREDELRIYGALEPSTCRRFAGAVISGPYAGFFVSDIAEEAAILGVHFKPGGAFAILGIPAREFTNTHVDLATVWGPEGAVLREQLCALREPLAQFRLLEHALLKRLAEPSRRHGAVRLGIEALMRTRGRAMVRDVAKAAELSQRRFTELFASEVGLTPKLFGRVQRFQHAVAASQNRTKVDWAGVAAECGYFDQSHLIREFIELSGVSPTDYRRRQERLDRAGVHVKRHHLPLAG
jgi:AraC-like DNA-binding protein